MLGTIGIEKGIGCAAVGSGSGVMYEAANGTSELWSMGLELLGDVAPIMMGGLVCDFGAAKNFEVRIGAEQGARTPFSEAEGTTRRPRLVVRPAGTNRAACRMLVDGWDGARRHAGAASRDRANSRPALAQAESQRIADGFVCLSRAARTRGWQAI